MAAQSLAFAHDLPWDGTTYTECEDMFGKFRKHFVARDRLTRTFENTDQLRPIYRSNDPDKNLIVLISRDRHVRLEVAKEIARRNGLPTFIPGAQIDQRQTFKFGEPLEAIATPQFGFIQALAIVENLGRVPAAFWSAGDTFLTYLDRQKQHRYTFRHDMVVTVALMQNHFGYGHWATEPLRTFFDNIERESGATELSGRAVRRLAAIYLVDPPDPWR